MKESLTITYNNTEIGELRGFIDEHGEPWFFAGKVCDCLKIKNSREAVRKLKEKHLQYGDKIEGVMKRDILIQTAGGKQKTTVINENLLYELIFQSRTEKAFKFQQWVFTEVLPALRKRGEYRMNGKLIRRSLTDVIKTEICEITESVNEKRFAYKNYTNLIYKSLGLKPPVDRDSLPEETLEKIAKKENLVSLLIQDGKSYNQIKDIILGA